jgi:hypothetical protein
MTQSRVVWGLARVQAAMVFLQAVFAGGFLSGRTGLRYAHGVNAGLLWLVSVVLIVVAVVTWRRGRSPGWVAAVASGLWVALEVQIAAGEAGMLWIHIPLGVAIFGIAVATVIGTRMGRSTTGATRPTTVDGRSVGTPQLPPPPAPMPSAGRAE